MKARPKRVKKVEVAIEEQPKEETQACADTPRPKSKGPNRGTPPRLIQNQQSQRRLAKEVEKGKRANLSKSQKNDNKSASLL